MPKLQEAVQTQIKNIEAKTGKTLAQLRQVAASSKLVKHGELRAMFIKELQLVTATQMRWSTQ